jgi:hypothetical protein
LLKNRLRQSTLEDSKQKDACENSEKQQENNDEISHTVIDFCGLGWVIHRNAPDGCSVIKLDRMKSQYRFHDFSKQRIKSV